MRRETKLGRPGRVAAVLALALGAGLLVSPAPAAARRDCGPGVTAEVRDGRVLCHHPDQAPPGVDLRRNPSTDELARRRYGESGKPARAAGTEFGSASFTAANTVACIGDGTDGNRVQAVYARASDVPDRFASVAPLIEEYAADADYQLNVSAALSGRGRRIRYVTDDCALDIQRVTLSPSGDNTFSASRNELRALGYDRPDRKYLVWVDAGVGICGIAEMYPDDRASADNWNNEGGMFARVDAPCWGYAEAHELLHTIGAVQYSAPHTSGGGHCVDENDTMCYSDGSGVTMVSSCPAKPSWHVDCNLDDYFNAAPADGSYLATHWNAAGSIYLEGAPPLPKPPSISVSAPSSFYAGNAVTVSASVSVPAGRTFTIGWTTSAGPCRFTKPTGASSLFSCTANAYGSGQITATVVDSLGMKASATKSFTLKVPSKPRATTAGISLSKRQIAEGRKATLTGRLVDAITGKPVVGMRVTIYYRRAGSSAWRKAATRTTDVSGRIRYTVKPSRTTSYRIASWTTGTWASDWSTAKKVRVV